MMKKCTICGALLQDDDKFCMKCGSCMFASADAGASDAAQPEASETVDPQTYTEPAKTKEIDRGNVIAGGMGAVLFALLSGLLYFGFYQLGIIAGICGIAAYALADFGYGLFAKTRDNYALRTIICMAAVIIAIYIAERCCIAFEVLNALEGEAGFFEIYRAIPEVMKADPEFSSAVVEEYASVYTFTAAAFLLHLFGARKKKKHS